jgi:hypothetical protein
VWAVECGVLGRVLVVFASRVMFGNLLNYFLPAPSYVRGIQGSDLLPLVLAALLHPCNDHGIADLSIPASPP